jgi:hypothetical protein
MQRMDATVMDKAATYGPGTRCRTRAGNEGVASSEAAAAIADLSRLIGSYWPAGVQEEKCDAPAGYDRFDIAAVLYKSCRAPT